MHGPSESTRTPRTSFGALLPLVLIVLLLVSVPQLIANRGPEDVTSAELPAAVTVTTMVELIIDGSQKSAILVMAALAFLYFRRLIPVLWSLILQSITGLLVAFELGVIFWFIYGGLAGIGMPGLFWSPQPVTMMQAALGVTLLVYWLLYLVLVRDFEIHRHHPELQLWVRFHPVLESSGLAGLFARAARDTGATGQFRWFLLYASLPALLALAVPAVLPAARPGDGPTIVQWPWLEGMALGVLAVWVISITRAATRMHELWRQVLERRIDFRRLRELDPDRLDPHANTKNILLVIFLVYVASYVDEFISGRGVTLPLMSPAFSICVMLGLIATLVTYVGTRRWSTRVIILVAFLALAAAAGILDYEVEIRELHRFYPSAFAQLMRRLSPKSAAATASGNVRNLEEFQKSTPADAAGKSHAEREKLLDRWVDSFRTPGDAPAVKKNPILVVVSTSGGALRAAIWTQTVLNKLDDQIADFSHHVRLITGASGGMLGAARYVSAHADAARLRKKPDRVLEGQDYLTPIAWRIAFRDFFPMSLVPWATYNRGDALEDAWIERHPAIASPFGKIKPEEDAGLVPSIVFSPMMVEDGRRVLISNLPLHDLAVILGEGMIPEDHATLQKLYKRDNPTADDPDQFDLELPDFASVPAVELFRLLPQGCRDKLTLASAVRMSATFPFITSSVTLPVDPPRHVVDAGYYDNYGVNLAAAWITSHREWIKNNASGVLVIQIRAFRNEKRLKVLSEQIASTTTSDADATPQGVSLGRVLRFFPWLVSLVAEGLQSVVLPFEGLAKARDSSMYFRNDEQIRGLKRMFTEVTHDDEFYRSVVFTCDTLQVGQEAQNAETLNWYIDANEFDMIHHNMEPYQELDAVAKTGVGRDRNDLRLQGLLNWWRSREGKATAPAKR